MNKQRIGIFLAKYASIAFGGFAFFYLFTINSYLLFVNNLITGILSIILFSAISREKISYDFFANSLILITFVALININLVLGGFDSPMLYWLLATVLGTGFLKNSKWMILSGIIVSIFYVFTFYLNFNGIVLDFQVQLPQNLYNLYHLASLIGVVSLAVAFAWSYIINTHKYNQRIQESYNKNNLLLKILNHDLSNPVTILGYSIHKLNAENLVHTQEKMLNANNTIIDIINSVRTIDKIQFSKVQMKDENLLMLTQKCVNEIAPLFSDKQIKFKIQLDENISIKTSKEIFSNQIIKNLLTNACKFSHADSFIDITYNNSVLQIRDYGVGIPVENFENLFDYSSNISERGTRGEKGTGFGLPIVKECCDKLGINLIVKSHSEGTSFFLEFNKQY